MPNRLIPGTKQHTDKQADISMSAHSHKLVLEHIYGLSDLCLTCNEAGVGGGGRVDPVGYKHVQHFSSELGDDAPGFQILYTSAGGSSLLLFCSNPH